MATALARGEAGRAAASALPLARLAAATAFAAVSRSYHHPYRLTDPRVYRLPNPVYPTSFPRAFSTETTPVSQTPVPPIPLKPNGAAAPKGVFPNPPPVAPRAPLPAQAAPLAASPVPDLPPRPTSPIPQSSMPPPASAAHTIPALAKAEAPKEESDRRTKPEITVELAREQVKRAQREAFKVGPQPTAAAAEARSADAAVQADAVAAAGNAVATPAAPKKSLWERVKEEAIHYWHGTKLLGVEISISTRLLIKLLQGDGLTRREHKQLLRTVADLVRLVPFIILIIIPFAELALPLLLRFFPNMLPSTFESQFAAEERRKKLVKVRLEMARFLQDTIQEVWVAEGTNQSVAVKEFKDFFQNYRDSDQLAPTEEIVRIARKFDESLTLDNLTHQQLASLCRFMGLTAFGTDNFLRFQVRSKLRDIKRDDAMIAAEGISALNLDEVRAAASQRGIRTVGISPARLRQELQQWLDLSLNYKIPGTLLLLSRALAYDKAVPVSVNTPEALQAALQSLPAEAVAEAETVLAEAAGEKVDYKKKLEVIRRQEELIKMELAQVKKEKEEKVAAPEPAPAPAPVAAPAPSAPAPAAAAPAAEPPAEKPAEPAPAPAAVPAAELRTVQIPEQQLRALGEALQVMGSPSALDPEREELERVKQERREYEEDLSEIKTMTGSKGESPASRYLGKRLERLISKIDKELKHYDKDIGDRLNLLRPDEYGNVTVEQLEEALKVINAHRENPAIGAVVAYLDENRDGLIMLKEVLQFAKEAERAGEEKAGEGKLAVYDGQTGLAGDIITTARQLLEEEQSVRNARESKPADQDKPPQAGAN